jgi:hypothetical protein
MDRSLATIAELAFVLQLMEWFNITNYFKKKIVMGIIIAEISCWMGVISGISYWHVVEEIIWWWLGVFLLYWIKFSQDNIRYKATTKCLIYSYIVYMMLYDIPTYLYRPEATKQRLLTCEVISTDMSLWIPSLIWMTGYFTFGSWISIAIS